MKLGQLGEDKLLARLAPALGGDRRVSRGVGDDCAVLRSPSRREWLLFKTDAVVAGVHFSGETLPRAVGWKAMMRPLSDFAAMSGVAEFALVTLIASRETEVAWVKQLYRGLQDAATAFGVAIAGGETSSGRETAISVSVLGNVEKSRVVFRDGGKPGDDLFVTGKLGGSSAGRHLRFRPRIIEARWLTRNFPIHAMMDLSDGLGTDLPRLATASGLSFSVNRHALPRTRGCTVEQAITDGEDYELLFALSPRHSGNLLSTWVKRFPSLALTQIGKLDKRSKIKTQRLTAGYVHFKECC